MPDSSQDKGFRVTVEDLACGESQSMIVSEGDYMLIPFAPCHLEHTQRSANGTVQITLKGHSPRRMDQSAARDQHQARRIHDVVLDAAGRDDGGPALPARETPNDDVNPVCGCRLRSRCDGCGTCTSCDDCYCGED